jgi:hypothetical protein
MLRVHASAATQLSSSESFSSVGQEALRPLWTSFAAAVSGEWEGISATFSNSGQPLPLPEYYVPQVGW